MTSCEQQFPFDKALELRFEHRRAALSTLDAAARAVEEVRRALPRRYPFVAEGDRLAGEAVERVLGGSHPGLTLTPLHRVVLSQSIWLNSKYTRTGSTRETQDRNTGS